MFTLYLKTYNSYETNSTFLLLVKYSKIKKGYSFMYPFEI
jgi:hypothetical protein